MTKYSRSVRSTIFGVTSIVTSCSTWRYRAVVTCCRSSRPLVTRCLSIQYADIKDYAAAGLQICTLAQCQFTSGWTVFSDLFYGKVKENLGISSEFFYLYVKLCIFGQLSNKQLARFWRFLAQLEARGPRPLDTTDPPRTCSCTVCAEFGNCCLLCCPTC